MRDIYEDPTTFDEWLSDVTWRVVAFAAGVALLGVVMALVSVATSVALSVGFHVEVDPVVVAVGWWTLSIVGALAAGVFVLGVRSARWLQARRERPVFPTARVEYMPPDFGDE